MCWGADGPWVRFGGNFGVYRDFLKESGVKKITSPKSLCEWSGTARESEMGLETFPKYPDNSAIDFGEVIFYPIFLQ